jgi:hypothetical protein
LLLFLCQYVNTPSLVNEMTAGDNGTASVGGGIDEQAASGTSRSLDSLELLIREADELRAKLDAERSKLQDVPSERMCVCR